MIAKQKKIELFIWVGLILLGIAILMAAFGKTNGSELRKRAADDPLPSWNEGSLKRDIVAYVEKVSTDGSDSFIPLSDRIAVFDNDGTLWSEVPTIEMEYLKVAMANLIRSNPSLAQQQPYKAIIAKDKKTLAALGEKQIAEAVLKALSGTTEEQFDASVRAFFDTAHFYHDNTQYPIRTATYRPQLELLNYLRSKGFKTFICTGGTIEFVRGISEQYYGIPEEQVIGTKLEYKFDEASRHIMRLGKNASICDKAGKPVNIQWHIGKTPVFACGNERSGGDIQMLQFSGTSKYPSFQLLINHDDGVREFAYQEKDSASLKAAQKGQWHVVSMKSDWKTVFEKAE